MTFEKWWEGNLAAIKASYRATWDASRNDALKEWLGSERKIPRKLPVVTKEVS